MCPGLSFSNGRVYGKGTFGMLRCRRGAAACSVPGSSQCCMSTRCWGWRMCCGCLAWPLWPVRSWHAGGWPGVCPGRSCCPAWTQKPSWKPARPCSSCRASARCGGCCWGARTAASCHLPAVPSMRATTRPCWARWMRDAMEVYLQGIQQAWVGASHASPAPLGIAYDRIASTANDAGIAARALACIAEVLGCMAQGEGGLRSGPAANREWASAFGRLESGDIAGGVQEMAAERQKWMSRPALLVRAARHYEGAEQILVRQAVMSSCQFITDEPVELPPLGHWVQVVCPARLDLSGGWSDTPPITYEHGGAVVDVAVLVDGCRPIGARVRRIVQPELRLVSLSGTPQSEVVAELVCRELEHLQDYCQPHAPGALLKAAFICTQVVQFPSQIPLWAQLMKNFGSGFEVHTWSKLPHGSGLGTSSILAGAVMASLYRAAGKAASTESLIHAVLHLEQRLTTGGGWQDQVGGLVPGIKIGRSKAQLPLRVEVEQIPVPDGFTETLNNHLLLVYTGKTRLARNLLQDVVRNWYARLPSIVQNADALVSNAEECAQALRQGDLLLLGKCLDCYWQQKKCMAPGCEPLAVGRMMDALRPYVYGQCLAGAGGGGFLYILTKAPRQKEALHQILANTEGLGNFSIHGIEVDTEQSLSPPGESQGSAFVTPIANP
ncbi:hypothetical protein IHE44_0002342 [Lamprotornis superbus]|uniref:L-fucose kinase n=1 Tax=Lamprotornis superbus TaxID=245042 RepID=A0A835NWQ4_9PASS|nr:hypothetical protein IHE44_0002342 [Lamprotornis superbus]